MKIESHDIYINNQTIVSVNFDTPANASGTSLSSALWAIVDGVSVTLGTQSDSGNVSQSPVISGATAGCTLISCTATMANSEKYTEYVRINVVDPGGC